ncbi:MAG: DUF4878 domain-containing protein [Chitinophagaceae bacterium]|nr:DUF4878 domain-containing protein [Chitinophagaceae bacterium]
MFRNSLFFSLSLILVLGFSACNNNNPKVVAEKFLLSVARADLDEAKKLCDSNTKELLDQANYLSMVPDSVKEEGRNLKITIVNVKENGNNAVVTYTTSKLDENQIISLVKIDNKWLVQLDKMQEYDDEPMLTESNDLPVESSANASTDSAKATTDIAK